MAGFAGFGGGLGIGLWQRLSGDVLPRAALKSGLLVLTGAVGVSAGRGLAACGAVNPPMLCTHGGEGVVTGIAGAWTSRSCYVGGRQSVVSCESVRPQQSVMGIGTPPVSATLKPAENFLEEMVDKRK